MQCKVLFFLHYGVNSKNLLHLRNAAPISFLEIPSSGHEYEYEHDHGNEHGNGNEHDNGNEYDIRSIYISSIWLPWCNANDAYEYDKPRHAYEWHNDDLKYDDFGK